MATPDGLQIVRYTAAHKERWDAFVAASRNGTFLLMRDYMDYHSHRFDDYSLLFERGGELVALLPGHVAGNEYRSHNGLTYGGLVLGDAATAVVVMDIFALLRAYLKEKGFVSVVYRPVPHIYHRRPCEEDLYALYRNDAVLVERKISSAVALREPLPFSTLRTRKVKKAAKMGFSLCEGGSYATFWNVLQQNLLAGHNAVPVHSLQEIELLAERFPANIKLFTVTSAGSETVAGTVLFVTDKVAHVQYIGSLPAGREGGAVDFLFDKLVHELFAGKEFFDFGTSVEQGGRYLNEGLIFQKEGFGGRAVVYDTYKMNL